MNNTTVEVNFKNNIDDIKALNFAIEGLKVENAVVKQTDKSVAVITTSAQEAGKTYTVTESGNKLGSFQGVSAVLPTAVKVVDRSIQGVTGKEVTVKAQVTVEEGKSKAGIPVTFYVAGSADGLVPAITAEAVTNEDGVASYTYTRYVAQDDTVTVYSTGDRSKFHTGVVHWGVATQLTIEEVTTGDTIQNGSNKTYKIKYVSPTSGGAVSGKSLNIAFMENIGVTADKLVTTATVNGVNPRDISGTTTVAANVVTDSKGEAVFTVSGTNAKVTPVVYEADGTASTPVTQVGYSSTSLQAKAPTVTFAAKQADNTITITGEGTKDATIGASNARKFTVDVKDKDGKVVANQVVKVSLQEQIDNVIGTSSPAYFVTFDSAGNVVSTHTPTLGNPISVVTDSNGKATFYLGSNTNADYGTPVAWIDINTSNAYANNVLEQTEPNAVGETTYFWTEKLVAAKLVAKNHTTGLEASTITANATDGIARYEFHLTNQTGKTISNPGLYVTAINARYNINNSGAGAVAVFDNAAQAQAFRTAVNALGSSATAQQIIALVPAGAKYISANNADFLDVNTLSNALYVVSADFSKTTNVSVTASATATNVGATPTYTTLVVAEAKTVTLASATAVGATEVGKLAGYNTTNKTFTITTANGNKTVKYDGETGKTYKFVGLNGVNVPTATDFITLVTSNGGANITYIVSGDTVTFSINAFGGGAPTNEVAANQSAAGTVQTQINALVADGTDTIAAVQAAYAAYNALTADQKALVNVTKLNTALDSEIAALNTTVGTLTATNYTTNTWTAVTTAQGLTSATLAEKSVKLNALDSAVSSLAEAVSVTNTGLVLTFTEAITVANPVAVALGTVTGSAAGFGTTAAAVSGTGSNVVTVTLDSGYTPATNDTITLNVTVKGIAQAVTITFNGTSWAVTAPTGTIR